MIHELGSLGVFIAIAICIVVAFTFFVHKDEKGSIYLFSILSLIILAYNNGRGDRDFLLKHVESPYLQMSLEYLVISLPFALFGIFHLKHLMVYVGFLLIVPYLSYKIEQVKYNWFIRKIPNHLFEWKSGIRKGFPLYLILVIVIIASSFYKIMPLIFIWLFTTAIISFFDQNEPVSFLQEKGSSAKQFLFTKIKDHLSFYSLFIVPILIINTIFNPDYLLINLGFYLSQLALLIFAIVYKYKSYIPNMQFMGNSNFTATIALMSAVPYFFPLPIIITFMNFNKAIDNLQPFFDHD